MRNILTKGVRKAGRAFGFDIRPIKKELDYPPDVDPEFVELFKTIQPYTMTSLERALALSQSVEYVIRQNIPGDIVECGVWKGGSMMAVAKTLMQLNASRPLHLFDTFEGMSEPTEHDRDLYGNRADEQMESEEKNESLVWAYSPLDDVRKNVLSTGYDSELIKFVKGKVEDTLPEHAPDRISLLRLDTDWFESTYHELQTLYPRLSVGGVLIIDDYGHWAGARKAVDQYFEENNLKLLLFRVDYTGRACVKLE